MGLKESLITNWEDKTIEYQGKKMYIIKQFEYEKVEYLYAVDLATINNENYEVAFLYKVKDDIFANVDNDELFQKLVVKGGTEIISTLLKEDIQKLQKEGKI